MQITQDSKPLERYILNVPGAVENSTIQVTPIVGADPTGDYRLIQVDTSGRLLTSPESLGATHVMLFVIILLLMALLVSVKQKGM